MKEIINTFKDDMEEIINKIKKKADSYSEILKEREDDEWLKGFIAGLLEARQEIQTFKR